MRILALRGERAQALGQYAQLKKALQDELGVEPMPETTAVYKAILENTLSAEPRAAQPARLRDAGLLRAAAHAAAPVQPGARHRHRVPAV